MFDGDDPRMEQAYKAAQQSFKYFWRELSWERRRIVPGLDMAMIKLPFTDGPRTDGNPEFEFMWCDEIDFDGQELTGVLLNSPNGLTSVKVGDSVQVPLSHLADWMMTVDGVAYGGHTVNLMRSQMDIRERKSHDAAWGLDFGDPNHIRVEIVHEKPKESKGFFAKLFGSKSASSAPVSPPVGFQDHPMCTNMLGKIEEQLQADPSVVSQTFDSGWTLLQMEALAGNFGAVRLLVRYGADVNAKTPDGRDAATLARNIGWNEIAAFLTQAAGG